MTFYKQIQVASAAWVCLFLLERKENHLNYLKRPTTSRQLVEVTNSMLIAGGVGSSSQLVGTNLVGTLLDPQFQGKDVFVDIAKISDDGKGFPLYDGGPKVVKIIIPWSLRHGLRKYPGTEQYQISVLLSISNELVQAVGKKDRSAMKPLLRRFSAAYAEEMTRTLNEGVGRPRNSLSGMLVAAVDIKEDAFTAKSYSKRDFSNLQVGEIGLSEKVLNKLTNKSTKSRRRAQKKLSEKLGTNVTDEERSSILDKIQSLEPKVRDGDKMIVSRWPVTDVIPAKIKILEEESKKDSWVAYVPADPFMFLKRIERTFSEVTDPTDVTETALEEDLESSVVRFMKLVEGDNDGDGLNFNIPVTTDAKAEVSAKYDEMYANAFRVQSPASNLTWKDHVDEEVDERSMLLDKMEQKLWIGALSILMYAYYAYSEWKIGRGDTPSVTSKEWLEAMTLALELCFDKKHNNNSDPRPLYGCLNRNAKYPWTVAAPMIEAQGLNTEVFGKVVAEIMTSPLRDCALLNTPFRIMYMSRNLDTQERSMMVFNFLREIPDDSTIAKYFLENLAPSLTKEVK